MAEQEQRHPRRQHNADSIAMSAVANSIFVAACRGIFAPIQANVPFSTVLLQLTELDHFDLELCSHIFTGLIVLRCDLCGRRFARRDALTAHKRTHVDDGLVHVCNICTKTFRKKRYLFNHISRMHATKVPEGGLPSWKSFFNIFSVSVSSIACVVIGSLLNRSQGHEGALFWHWKLALYHILLNF